MNALRIPSCVFVVLAGLFVTSQQAAAAPALIACGTAIDDYFSGRLPGAQLRVVGAQVTARGDLGYADLVMAPDYLLATMPFNTPAASSRNFFIATKGLSSYDGLFHEIFNDRGNNAVDLTELWISQTGAVWLRSITWNGAWAQMQSTRCYRGPRNQTVITGYFDYADFFGFFTFVLVGT